MEILILILSVLLLIALVGRVHDVRRRDAFNMLSSNDKEKVLAENKRKQDEADKIITIVLPTINNDKIEK